MKQLKWEMTSNSRMHLLMLRIHSALAESRLAGYTVADIERISRT